MSPQFHLNSFHIEPIERDISIVATTGKDRIRCTIKKSAIEELYAETYLTKEDQKVIFTRHADIFSRILAKRYTKRSAERDGSITIDNYDMLDYQRKFGKYIRPSHTIWEDA